MLRIVPIGSLRPHEEIDSSHKEEIKQSLLKEGVQIEPILVEKEYSIILDGHHRVEALKELGFQKVLAYLVDYKEVKLKSWKPKTKIKKEDVVKAAFGKRLLVKTTKHTINGKPNNVRVGLDQLR